MPSLFAVLTSLACAAAPALADSLQGHVLAGRSVQAAAAAGAGRAAGATQPAAGEAARPEVVLGKEFGIGEVKVTLVDARDPKAVFATSTGADGRFSIDGLAAGSYRVTFTHGTLGQRTMQAMVGKGVGELVFVWETAPGRPPGDLPLPAAKQ